jgi:hypothetical protein
MILEYTSPSFLISDHEADKTKPLHCSFWGGSHIIEFHFLLFKLFICYVFSPSESNAFQSSTIYLKLTRSDNRKTINYIKTAVWKAQSAQKQESNQTKQ